MACYKCLETGSLHCVQTDDMVNEIIDKCIEADGIILASPVYHGGIAGGMKCVMDRVMLAAGCVTSYFMGIPTHMGMIRRLSGGAVNGSNLRSG